MFCTNKAKWFGFKFHVTLYILKEEYKICNTVGPLLWYVWCKAVMRNKQTLNYHIKECVK